MRDEFSKHQCLGQDHRRLLEAPEETVSRSFLCLGFIVGQSVIVSQTACLFCGAECVVRVVVCVIKIIVILVIIISETCHARKQIHDQESLFL